MPIGATHNFGAPSNWDEKLDGPCNALPIRAGVHGDRKLLTYTSAWRPTAEELAALIAGAVVEVELVGQQPPMIVRVVQYVPELERKTVTINEHAHGMGHDEHGPATP
jgi:hypothetical protein